MVQNAKANKNKQNKGKKNLQEKSTQLKKKVAKKSVCPWMCGTFLLFLAVGGVIGYDTYLHDGVFEKSATGKVLKDIGALPYVETAWYKTMSNGARGYQWLETNVPVYYGKTKVVLKPYTDLTCDLYKITLNTFVSVFEWGRNYVVTKPQSLLIMLINMYLDYHKKFMNFHYQHGVRPSTHITVAATSLGRKSLLDHFLLKTLARH